MTELESNSETMVDFGANTGRVIRFFNRKGYGFVKDLNDDNEYFVHNSEIKCSSGIYRKLYPGEYVSYSLVERDGKPVCSGVKGIMGYPLLVENTEHTFRVYPKQGHREWPMNTGYSESSDSDSDRELSDNEGIESDNENDPEPEKEFINKEAPEGIEVAEFDGLNINEEMG
jgi:cold shock CspA family protein